MLLQEDTELAVTLLHLFMELFQHLAESVGKYNKQHSAGQENAGKPPVKYDHHNDSTNELDHHSHQSGEYFHIAVSDNHRVIGEPVEPFARMDGIHTCKVFSQDIVHQPSLEDIFKSRF